MSIRDLKGKSAITSSILPQTITADTNGTAADLRNFSGALLLIHVGNSGDTLSGLVYTEVEIEESDDNSTFTDVADADLDAYVDGTNDGCVAKIDAPAEDSLVLEVEYHGGKRYVRPVINVTGSHSSGTPISAVIIAYDKRSTPA